MNIVASCIPCNGYMEHNEAPFWVWYVKQFGAAQMEKLERMSHGTANFSIGELETMRDEYKKKIERRLSHYRLFLDQTKQKSGLLRLNLYAR